MQTWTRHDLLKVIEVLIEKDCPLYAHPDFRRGMDRIHNLFANQLIREGNSNVAYRSVDFDLDGLSDDEIWTRLDRTKHTDLIEENAATAILKMAARFNLVN